MSRLNKKAAIKIAGLIVFVVFAIWLVRFTAVRDHLTAEKLARFLDASGIWAPVIFMLIYAAGVCLFVPGTILTALGAAIFGAYWGFVYVWIGAMFGASLAFLIGRTLGREFAASLIGDRLKKYDDAIEKNGFAVVLYLRLAYFPFTPMNFGMGLTKVRFLDYMMGTGLGILVGTFVFTFLIGTLKDIWMTGDWPRLISMKIFLAVVLFAFSLLIPKLVNRIPAYRAYAQKENMR